MNTDNTDLIVDCPNCRKSFDAADAVLDTSAGYKNTVNIYCNECEAELSIKVDWEPYIYDVVKSTN